MTSVKGGGVEKQDHKVNTLIFYRQQGAVVGRLPQLIQQKR